MKILRVLGILLFLGTMLVSVYLPARADYPGLEGYWVGFEGCSSTSAANTHTGIAQLIVYVAHYDTNKISFTFINKGPVSSEIENIYFWDGLWISWDKFDYHQYFTTPTQDVSFTKISKPAEPGLGCRGKEPTHFFRGDSIGPDGTTKYSIGPGEEITIVFNLLKSWDEVKGALDSGNLNFGIHVQSFPNGGSEGFVNSGATAIKLLSFGANSLKDKIVLQWETGSEMDNAGFNLFRAATPDGSRTQVNPSLIAALGDPTSGAKYAFEDTPGAGKYYYWLEDVDQSGIKTLHGPVEVASAKANVSFRPSLFLPIVPSRH